MGWSGEWRIGKVAYDAFAIEPGLILTLLTLSLPMELKCKVEYITSGGGQGGEHRGDCVLQRV